MSNSTVRRHLPGALVALVFFGIGLVTLPDYGVTWDEHETYWAAEANVLTLGSVLHGGPGWYPFHELTGYCWVFDTLRGLFARAVTQWWPMTDVPSAFHFFHLVLSAATIHLLYLIALDLSGLTRPALLAAAALALFPKFVAHSQNNAKDLVALFVFVLAMRGLLRVGFRGGWRRALGAGLVLGLALATHILSAFVPVACLLWLLLFRRDLLRIRGREFVLCFVVAPLAGVLFWPWLWPAPCERLWESIRYVATFRWQSLVLYFGRIYSTTALPWHYFLGSFLVSSPVAHLFFGCWSLTGFSWRRARTPSVEALTQFGLVWCAVLVVAEVFSASRYDGVRHFLVFYPGVCLLIGCGAERCGTGLVRWFARRGSPVAAGWIGWGCVAATVVPTCVSLVTIHPYADAYLNEVTNALLPGPAEDYFEVEYWGSSYGEGARWLAARAEPDAILYAFWHENDKFYLTGRFRAFDPSFLQNDGGPPRYAMLMSRKAAYDDFMRVVVRDYEPVFAIRRQKATLMRIFKNTVRRPSRAGNGPPGLQPGR